MQRSRRDKLVAKRSTGSLREFKSLCKLRPRRTAVVSAGDSWFAYPPRNLVGRKTNVIDFLKDKEHFNLLELSRNGNEVLDFLSGASKFRVQRAVAASPVHFLLLSGGGNDLVGDTVRGDMDFHFLLRENRNGSNFLDFVHQGRLERKIRQIRDAYTDLVDWCAEYAANPEMNILTHCYGYAVPQDLPGRFLGGLASPGPWMYPALVKRKVPEVHWRAIIRHLIDQLKQVFQVLQGASGKRFHFVDTTILINEEDWLDEIHLTPAGFKRVADAFFTKMEALRTPDPTH